VTAARELTADDTVLKDPLNIPATNNPARPGICFRVSTTYRGINWGKKEIN
jgi:hypothetical protein